MNLIRSGKVNSSVSQVALRKARRCPYRGRSVSSPYPYHSSRSPSASPTPSFVPPTGVLLVNSFRSGKVKSSVSQVALKKAKKCPCRGRSASYPHLYPSSRSPSASPTPTRSFPCSFTGECEYLSVMSVDALSVMSVDVVMSVDAVCNLWMLSVMSMDAVWMRFVCNICVCGCALSMMSVDALCLMLYVISVDALCLWMRSFCDVCGCL